MEIKGTVKVIGESQTFGSNGFTKREVVLTTEKDSKYPQDIMIEFTQDNCDLIDPYAEGEDVIISVNLRGREWVNPQGDSKYFNSLNGWRIERDGSVSGETSQETPTHETDTNPLPF